ncbi:MAG: hypothetical protein WCI94_06605 [Rhodospirillales bacterium]|jgi:hypothetical protein
MSIESKPMNTRGFYDRATLVADGRVASGHDGTVLRGIDRLRMSVIAVFALIGLPAQAADPAAPNQLAGLFVQGCLPFAGQPVALRAWATQHKLPELPDVAARRFLHDAPGRAFDGSAPGTKLVLASSDDGICSVVTDKAVSAAVATALEAGLKQAGATFRLAIDRDDTGAKALHFREYLATRAGRSWRILAATVNDPAGGQAMLTAAPE